MRRFIALLLAVLIIIACCPAVISAVDIQSSEPSKTINLVYDDSGSMIVPYEINGEDVYCDRWCQAKYALEVFAAMLGEKDTLNVYLMSDFANANAEQAKTIPPSLSLSGADGGQTNVPSVHNMQSWASGTPYTSVSGAYEQLKNVGTDERWLVILTDGAFYEGGYQIDHSETQSNLEKYAGDGKTKVMVLTMGDEFDVQEDIKVKPFKSNSSGTLYATHADNSAQILSSLTDICNRIFQKNELDVNTSTMKASFGVPMSELIVFAQGENVSIGNMTNASGVSLSATSNVNVRYSEEATTNTNSIYTGANKDKIAATVARDLNGYVATFEGNIEPGEYTFDITGADTVKVYYKPNVTIATHLYESESGNEVSGESDLPAGNYTLEFGFVNATTGEPIEDTSLLGDIEFTANVITTDSDGNENVTTIGSGDQITVGEGGLQLDISANFLEYNTVNTVMTYEVFGDKYLVWSFDEKPEYSLALEGLENGNEAIVATVKMISERKEVELTAEQWAKFKIDEVSTKSGLGKFKFEKSDEIGKVLIYPTLAGDAIYAPTGEIDLYIAGGFENEGKEIKGSSDTTFTIIDAISTAERITEWLKQNGLKLLIVILIILLILGYIPPFKKYLPGRIKARPKIHCVSEKPGINDKDIHGKFQKNLLSTLIPYKPQTGSIKFAPRKVARVKAAGGGGIYITNYKTFAGKTDVTFNGMPVQQNQSRPLRIPAATTATTFTEEFKYNCNFTQ